jgi:hypothetical protein
VTTATKAPLLYSRCPLVLDEATGRRCNHPAIATVPERDVLLPEHEQMRHGVSCLDDRGHVWSVNWPTEHVLT